MNNTTTKNEIKTIYILIGYKGSGKTFIGKLFESAFGIKFLRVEPIFSKIKNNRSVFSRDYAKEGFILIRHEIEHLLNTHNQIVFESTGASKEFVNLLNLLDAQFKVILIKVDADGETCITRVKNRSKTQHIAVSDHELKLINFKASLYSYNFDFYLDNNCRTSEDLLIDIKCILSPNNKNGSDN